MRTFRTLVVPHCDVIAHVTQPADSRYRNATRYFTSAAQPPPPRDHVAADVTASRDPDVTVDDVMPTFRLVFVCLDVVILAYRVTHVCRTVRRMRNPWSRDHRSDDVVDDEDEYWSERTRTGLDQQAVDTLYQLPSSSSSRRCFSSSQSAPLWRIARSSYVSKLVLFAALVTSCHVTARVIDSSSLLSAHHADVMAAVTSHDAAVVGGLDWDVRRVCERQRVDMMTSFKEFVVNSLSHLSIAVQLISNGIYSLQLRLLVSPKFFFFSQALWFHA